MPKPPVHLLHRLGLALTLLAAPAVAAQSSLSLQQLQHSTWTSRDGLPVTGIFRIERTPDGYLWFGSSAGILRFDGIRFILVDSAVSSLMRSTGPVEQRPLLVDHRGAFLFTGKGGELVEYHDGTFREAHPALASLIRVGRGAEDRQHRVWFVVGNDRVIRQLHGGQVLPARFPAGVPDTGILGVIPDSGRGLWIGTRTQGLWHIGADHQAREYRVTAPDGSARPLLQDRDGVLWVLSQGLNALRDTAWSAITLPKRPKDPVQAVAAAQSADGAVWFATRGDGILRYRAGVTEQFTEADGLSDAVVHDLLIDPAGSVWISTDAGLDRLRVAPFVTIDRRLGLPFDSPLAIQNDADGSIWAASYGTGGLFHLDGGMIRRSAGPVRSVDPRINYPDHYRPIGPARNGGVWIIDAISQRLYRYHGRQFTPAAGIAAPPGLRWFEAVDAEAGHTWVGLQPRGIGVVLDGRFQPLQLRPGQPDPTLVSMARDPQDHLWVTTVNPVGLYEVTGRDQVREIPVQLADGEWLNHLAFEGPDTLWSAIGGDLVRVSQGRLARVTQPDLANVLHTASGVILIQDRYLWAASEGGVARVSLAELNRAADGQSGPIAVRLFDERDGLRVGKMTTLNRHPAFRAGDGRLWFSTPAGVAVFDPDAMRGNTIPPRPHIERLIVEGASVPLDHAEALAPNPTRVELHFTATDLVVPERAVLDYRLDGADREWVRSGPDRVVAYAQLRPGRYTFRVRAWNEDGVPGNAEATLVFRILPTWYQTWWFLALLLLLVAAAGAGVVYALQRARIRAANEQMQARYDATLSERTRLARELHDTLLQGFTGITLQLQAVQRTVVESPRDAAISLGTVLSTADVTLRAARQMVWDMRAPELDRHDLAEALEIAVRQVMTDTGIRLDMSVTGTVRQLDIGVATTTLRIGKEAVVNAVKHAAPTVITVTMHFAPAALSLLVHDDGRGCDAAMLEAAVEGGHWGIRGMQERAARAGGALAISGGTGRGTLISLTIPLTRSP